ncbi:replicative DNA helicase [compost metagenome]
MIDLARGLINESRRVSVMNEQDTFSLDDPLFDDNLKDVVTRLKDPARILTTGIRALNQILAPGFHSKRLYMLMGLPAGFKSGLLLKICRDIKLYNKEAPGKKPGMRKTVLLVTMENTVDESIERLFNMTITPDSILNYTTKQIIDMIKSSGEFTVEGEDDINIVIKYVPNMTINTEDLYTIIEDIEDDGREVIALVLDYIKRIRPTAKAKDEKEELKHVTNELKNLAIDRDIPVITAHQLNRGAATVVDGAMSSAQSDVARHLGRSNVGTAWEVINFCHLTLLIAGTPLELQLPNDDRDVMVA